MRLLFFADGTWATQSLLRLAQEGWELLGVVTRVKPSDPELLESAQALGLPLFQPTKVNVPDWSESSRNIYHKIIAMTYPGSTAITLLDGQVVTVWRAFYDLAWPSYIATPGQVVGRSPNEGIVVKTGDSTLLLQ